MWNTKGGQKQDAESDTLAMIGRIITDGHKYNHLTGTQRHQSETYFHFLQTIYGNKILD